MENIDIRNYIIENFKNDNIEKIRDSIETTISTRDEDALIGLGVLFELLWNKLSQEEKNNRLYKLNDLVNKYAKEANLKYQDQVVKVLLEGTSEKDDNMLMGYTETMKLVNVKADKKYIGQIKNVKITDVKTWSMDGELID